MLEDLLFRLRTLVRRGRVEDDLDDELRFHLERAVEQHVARGRGRSRRVDGPRAADPLAWGGAVVMLVTVGGLAHALPARRAVRVAPSAALRVE